MTNSSCPDVSIIFVAFNAAELIPQLVNSIWNSEHGNIEIVAVDDGSKDNTFDILTYHASVSSVPFKVLRTADKGPAFAINRALEVSSGRFVAFLGTDATPERNWLTEASKLLMTSPDIGAIQCKLTENNGRLDCVGSYLGEFGILVHRVLPGHVIDQGQFNRPLDIFSGKSAGMVFRLEAIKKAGCLDEDFYVYLEETDLCWRVLLSGFRVLFAPKSVVRHSPKTTFSKNPFGTFLSRYHGTRNYISMIIRNSDGRDLFRLLLLQLIVWAGLSLFLIVRKRLDEAKWVMKGIAWNFRNVRRTLRKRARTQHSRMIGKLPAHLRKKAGLGYYLRWLREW